MWLNNQFNFKPGVYRLKHSEVEVLMVATEVVTHKWENGEQVLRDNPLVVFRDLTPKAEKYITYSMDLNEFLENFENES